jgi:hypothetical protein
MDPATMDPATMDARHVDPATWIQRTTLAVVVVHTAGDLDHSEPLVSVEMIIRPVRS